MATSDEVAQALLDAIKKLADEAGQLDRHNATSRASFGSTAKDLAEAHAWLRMPNQPH
jgi:hypothetical protein